MDSSPSSNKRYSRNQRNRLFSPRRVDFKDLQPPTDKPARSGSILRKTSKYSPAHSPSNTKSRCPSMRSPVKLSPYNSCWAERFSNQSKIQYQKILAKHSHHNKFRDDKFPPELRSFTSNARPDKQLALRIKWVRISQLFAESEIVVVAPHAISGSLTAGSERCPQYLVQAFNFLSNNREFLKTIFQDQQYNKQGVYYVRIFYEFAWRTIIIDEYIPVYEVESTPTPIYEPIFTAFHYKRPASSSSTKTTKKIQKPLQKVEIWMYLLEKAFAKSYLSYQYLLRGNVLDFLSELTGYDAMKKVFHGNGPMTINPKTFFEGKSNKNWMIAGVNNPEFEENSVGSMKMERARSPWSRTEYFKDERGKIEKERDEPTLRRISSSKSIPKNILNNQNLDNSPNMVEIKVTKGSKLSYCPKSERLMLQKTILAEDIGKMFSSIYIWREHEYKCWISHIITKLKSEDSIILRRFQLSSRSQVCLSLYQKDIKKYTANSSYRYSWMRMILLLREPNGELRWIDGAYSNGKSLAIERDLEAGVYSLLILPEWNSEPFDLGLVLKSNVPTKIDSAMYQKEMLEKGCADHAQRYGRMIQSPNYCTYEYTCEEMGLRIWNINNELKNTTRDLKFSCSIDLRDSAGQVTLFNPQFNKKGGLTVHIPCNDEFTIVALSKKGRNKKALDILYLGK